MNGQDGRHTREYEVSSSKYNKTGHLELVAYPGNFFRGVQQIQLRTEDRENGDPGEGSPLVRGSGGSCNLVKEI